ncbi:HK97 gp10 family phage protein [Anaerophilus nitritogenes]|uniref:HK97 gp10 family phage protein n=1 Tax=Anaerophilus nitritogenes TaxID=2498136 RepID=UPI00101D4487|nr:HK97 gp10 family phage protein [Anaerophilus nitritogenes]
MMSFDDMNRRLTEIENRYKEDVKDTVQEVGYMIETQAKYNTPEMTGELRRSITTDNVEQNENVTMVTGGTTKKYAEAVENGHRTKNGGFVQGQFYMDTAIEQVKPQAERMLNEMFVNLFR